MHIIQQNGHPVGAEIDTPVRDAFMQYIVLLRWQMIGPGYFDPQQILVFGKVKELDFLRECT
jgi:hypothetical protein